MTEPSLDRKKLHQEKKKPKFWIDFVGFADYGLMIEATLALSPEFDITSIVDMQHGSDTARVITLQFRKKEQKLGRRGYSLKQEWEQPKEVESE